MKLDTSFPAQVIDQGAGEQNEEQPEHSGEWPKIPGEIIHGFDYPRKIHMGKLFVLFSLCAFSAAAGPRITVVRRADPPGVQVWLPPQPTNEVWFFEISTNLIDWSHSGNETVYFENGWRMTETGPDWARWFVRARKL